MNAVLRPGEYYRVTPAFEVYSFSNHSQHPALTLERKTFRLIPIHTAWHYAVDNVPHLQMQAHMKANNDNENQELLNLIGDDALLGYVRFLAVQNCMFQTATGRVSG